MSSYVNRSISASMGPIKYSAVCTKGENAKGRSGFARGIWTRKMCIVSLYISGFLAIFCLATGVAFFNEGQAIGAGWMNVKMPNASKKILPLFINALITILTESSALRWAMGNQLTFTSASSAECKAVSLLGECLML